jgi:hypothetical protein
MYIKKKLHEGFYDEGRKDYMKEDRKLCMNEGREEGMYMKEERII